MDEFKAWCLRIAGEFEPEVREAVQEVADAALALVVADPADRRVRMSYLLECMAAAEKRGNEVGLPVAGRLAALVLSKVMEVLV